MDQLIVVAYGDEIHLYRLDQAYDAQVLYTVAIGANLDAVKATMTPARWDEVRPALLASVDGETTEIHDHR